MSETMETKRALDYLPGDLVQLASKNYPGVLGTVVGTKLAREENFILYQVLISVSEDEYRIVLTPPDKMRFLSHAEE